jgi:hypothetical protein
LCGWTPKEEGFSLFFVLSPSLPLSLSLLPSLPSLPSVPLSFKEKGKKRRGKGEGGTEKRKEGREERGGRGMKERVNKGTGKGGGKEAEGGRVERGRRNRGE